jgi:prepilin-type N-terminal cleavage/methylation domain-containing protein
MKNPSYHRAAAQTRTKGFSLIELLIVVGIIMVVSAIAIPNFVLMVYNAQLNSAASSLAGLMQQARILAATQNPATPYQIRYAQVQDKQAAFIDLNGNGVMDAGEPVVVFPGSVAPTATAPNGDNGSPTAYENDADSGSGSYDNSFTLAFSPRGLPCLFDDSGNPPSCATPSAKYFVHYLTDNRAVGKNGWAAVLVTTSGRTRTLRWDGAAWR